MISYESMSVMFGLWRMFSSADTQLWRAPPQGRMSDSKVLTGRLKLLLDHTTTIIIIMDAYQSNPEVGSHSVWIIDLGCQSYSSELQPQQPSVCCDRRVLYGGQRRGIKWEVAANNKLSEVSWLYNYSIEQSRYVTTTVEWLIYDWARPMVKWVWQVDIGDSMETRQCYVLARLTVDSTLQQSNQIIPGDK